MSRHVPILSILTLLTGLLLSQQATEVFADDSQFARQLTGEAQRRWLLTEFEVFMGNDDKCLEGEDYTFSRNNTVLIRRCEAGKIIEAERNWSLDASDELDLFIRLGTETFVLVFFRNDAERDCLILRQRAKQKDVATRDSILCQERE